MNGFEEEYRGRLQVVRLNFNDTRNEPAIAALGARLHPSLYLINRQGDVQTTRFGAHTTEQLRPFIEVIAAVGKAP